MIRCWDEQGLSFDVAHPGSAVTQSHWFLTFVIFAKGDHHPDEGRDLHTPISAEKHKRHYCSESSSERKASGTIVADIQSLFIHCIDYCIALYEQNKKCWLQSLIDVADHLILHYLNTLIYLSNLRVSTSICR